MSSRIFYALQQVTVGSTVLSGVQSVGASSTTNIENFSRFGSTSAHTILQDLDLEITIENALGDGWANTLTAAGMTSAANAGSNVTVKVEYLTSDGVTKLMTLDAIISSYSIQMGVDGPATESVTFQNNGNAVFTAGTDGTALSTPTGNVCAVVTRPNFSGFTYAYSDDACEASPTWTAGSDSNLISVSASMDIGTEKVNVLGQSLSFGKFVTFPIETSMETETHLDPESGTYAAGEQADDTMGGFMSGSVDPSNTSSLLDRTYRTLIKLPQNYYGMSSARLTGVSRSGGDVGGGQVSITSSYSSVNDLFYLTTDPSSSITGTNFPTVAAPTTTTPAP